MQFDLFIIGIFLSSSLSFIAGFLACHFSKVRDNVIYVQQTSDGTLTAQQPLQGAMPPNTKLIETNSDAEKFSKREDVINHDGVGIVYRPTEAELTKMNESQYIRQAKEAMAETFAQERPPEV